MRIYLDQMLKVGLAEILRGAGHDVVRAEEVGQSRFEDDAILRFAVEEDRVLVTLDKDFGDWAILPLAKHPGVIRVKVHPPTTEGIVEILLPLLSRKPQEAFRNKLVILSPRNERGSEWRTNRFSRSTNYPPRSRTTAPAIRRHLWREYAIRAVPAE